MNEQVSSKTIAEGPGIVDYSDWQNFYYETREKISLLDEPAKTDITKFFENTQMAWIEYSRKSLQYKKHQQREYDKYMEARKTTEKYITWAGLAGMTK